MTKALALNVVIFIWGFSLGYILRAYISNTHPASQREMDLQKKPGMDRHRILVDFFKGLR